MMINDVLSAGQLTGWGVASILFVTGIFSFFRGWVYSASAVREVLQQARSAVLAERSRGDQWESAYHKLEAALELKRASEHTAFIEAVRTLASVVEAVQNMVEGSDHGSVPPPPTD